MKVDDMVEILHVYFDDIPFDDLTDGQIYWINTHGNVLQHERDTFESWMITVENRPAIREFLDNGNGFSSTDEYWAYLEKTAKKLTKNKC